MAQVTVEKRQRRVEVNKDTIKGDSEALRGLVKLKKILEKLGFVRHQPPTPYLFFLNIWKHENNTQKHKINKKNPGFLDF